MRYRPRDNSRHSPSVPVEAVELACFVLELSEKECLELVRVHSIPPGRTWKESGWNWYSFGCPEYHFFHNEKDWTKKSIASRQEIQYSCLLFQKFSFAKWPTRPLPTTENETPPPPRRFFSICRLAPSIHRQFIPFRSQGGYNNFKTVTGPSLLLPSEKTLLWLLPGTSSPP